MFANTVQVFIGFWLFHCIWHFMTIDAHAQAILRKPNAFVDDVVPNIARDGSTDIVFSDGTILIILRDYEEKMAKRALADAEVIVNRNDGIAWRIDGDEESDSSLEMAESHIFRPLFRYRVRKSSNARASF